MIGDVGVAVGAAPVDGVAPAQFRVTLNGPDDADAPLALRQADAGASWEDLIHEHKPTLHHGLRTSILAATLGDEPVVGGPQDLLALEDAFIASLRMNPQSNQRLGVRRVRVEGLPRGGKMSKEIAMRIQ